MFLLVIQGHVGIDLAGHLRIIGASQMGGDVAVHMFTDVPNGLFQTDVCVPPPEMSAHRILAVSRTHSQRACTWLTPYVIEGISVTNIHGQLLISKAVTT